MLVYRRQTSFTRMFQRYCLATQSYTLLALQQPFPTRQCTLLHICSVFLCSALPLVLLHSTVCSFLEGKHAESTSFLHILDEDSDNVIYILYTALFLFSYHFSEQGKIPQIFFSHIFTFYMYLNNTHINQVIWH